nr:coat protein [Phomopsis asparagi partitivirus 1]
MSSTVAPSDSVSASGKKSKPGKAERAARRAATGSVAGEPASTAKSMTFASAVTAPKPQPGKFPVVFQTGAGEPTRDVAFATQPKVLRSSLDAFLPGFKENPKYLEFLAWTEYDDDDFNKQVLSAALLRLAQQVVHSHVNMGLPQGDFAPVGSTEVRVPNSVAAFICQHGEFAVPALGTRYLYKDYVGTVKSLVWAASMLAKPVLDLEAVDRLWLPTSAHDGHTREIIADALNQFLAGAEVSYQSTLLEDSVLSGNRPASWDELKPLFGGPGNGDRFDFLFRAYPDAPSFVTAFTSAEAAGVLAELGLSWNNPSAGHVDWTFNVKEVFTTLADSWAQKSAAYSQFFEMSSSLTNRSAATGSQSQMATVSTTDGITIVKSILALSAQEFSLAACLPASCVFSGSQLRNVVITTPLSVKQRATEFIQLDWR